jgi:hypothetical protein
MIARNIRRNKSKKFYYATLQMTINQAVQFLALRHCNHRNIFPAYRCRLTPSKAERVGRETLSICFIPCNVVSRSCKPCLIREYGWCTQRLCKCWLSTVPGLCVASLPTASSANGTFKVRYPVRLYLSDT